MNLSTILFISCFLKRPFDSLTKITQKKLNTKFTDLCILLFWCIKVFFYSHSAKITVCYRNTLIKVFVSRRYRCTLYSNCLHIYHYLIYITWAPLNFSFCICIVVFCVSFYFLFYSSDSLYLYMYIVQCNICAG